RPMERDQMLLDGTLAQHLTNIDCEAHRQVESLTKVLAAEAKINEEMKRCNPLEWAAAMQGLQAQAEEIVCAELIYAEENTNDSLSLPGK
ncbi:TnpV protein, partial [Gemmiger sp.]